jgi:MoaA/NifB/PqqE/SkfB family radical SAM enzyme
MIDYYKIKSVEIEASSYCNAACPLCPRNVFGYPYQNGYTPTHLTLAQIKKIFNESFIKQLESLNFEGNLGDPLMNPELLEIIKFFKDLNPKINVTISTNGSLQSENFWKNLANLNVEVIFGIDGLEDTHKIYRRNTNWHKIITNAKIYIEHKGYAIWKMIKFDHNKHQIEQCEKLSKDFEFQNFILVDHGRNVGPVFDSTGTLEYVLGNYQGETDLSKIMDTILNGDILIEDIWDKPKKHVSCKAIENKGIYISAIGEVYPCCYMGFNPNTFGHGTWHQSVNNQIKNLLKKNNALEYSLEECIEWFNQIPNCWNKTTFELGRLIICDHNCGTIQKT